MGQGWDYGAAHGSPGYGVGMGLWGSLWFPWLWGRVGAMGLRWCYGAAHSSPGYGVGLGLWGGMVLWGSSQFPWLWGGDGAMGQLMVSLLMGLRWGYRAACGYGAGWGYGAGLWGCGVGTQHFAADP